jgi:hypothetical protein
VHLFAGADFDLDGESAMAGSLAAAIRCVESIESK